jgi:archaellin
MADGMFLKGIEQMGLGNIDLENDTIHLVPMATTYTPNYTTENFYSDVVASIASGASEIALTSLTFDIDTGNTRVEFDAANVSEASQTFSTNKFIIKKDTGNDATSPLICCIAFTEGTLSPVNGTFALTVNAEGFFSIASA